MNTAGIIMGILAVILIIVGYFIAKDLPLSGIKTGGKMLWDVLPILVFAFIIAGMVQVLIPREFIIKYLGAEAGFKGIMVGCVAGALTPGGPFVSFPIVASIWKAGAGIGTVVAFVTAWSLWAVGRLPYEISLISPKFALIRFLSTLIFPPLAGLIAQSFFSKL
ncbi:MAG: hypothetical protein AMJ90_09500 [candidate division Zixibacteria bacterium SM23_73_2]|nr:MAG: hypothetical protein AMJ90_09500 [candidate division Zixibacteria bacterium SM23_73_2]ODS38552.1 MAG: hypothetical protein A7315_12230 [Candidatus Altiarchaeales archaeon WOR_SM1_79]